MNISELSLKRPILTVVLSIIIILFGYVGLSFLSLREYPAVDPPVVTVRTNYTGANADIIESQITEPLEKAINGVQGIRTITSVSSNGGSSINVEFNLGQDLEEATNDVRGKVSQAGRQLPQDIDAPPIVTKADANADPIIIIGVQSKNKTLLELTDYSTNVVAEKLQTVPDVSQINIYGERKYCMRIWVKPEKLNAYNLTINDINSALNRENIELPAGKIYGNKTELTIHSKGRMETEDEFRNLIISQNKNGIIRLSDLAEVFLGPENEENNFRLNGAMNVGLAVLPQPGSNFIKIADEIYKRINEIKKNSDNDIELNIVMDSTLKVRSSLEEVRETLAIAFILVVLVIYFFFRNWSIALRPLIDIPVSLIGAFFIMYLADFSINVLTMLGIILATGLVVDDGIVVTENIYRKFEEGMPIKQAAVEGSKEIFFAVIATSITLAVVFLPVIFLQGFVGSLFREFGIVVGGAVLISAFVSLTLTPVLNVWMTKKDAKKSKFYKSTENFFKSMENGYRIILTGFMKIRWMAWVIIAVCTFLIIIIFNILQSEVAPLEDRSSIRFSITAPEGTSFDFMDDYVDGLAVFLRDSIPENKFVFAAANAGGGGAGTVNRGFARIVLTEPSERKRTQQDIVTYLNKKLPKFNDGRIFQIQEQTISVGFAARGSVPVNFVIQNLDFSKIAGILPKFLDEARKDPTFQVVDADLKFNKPELIVTLDRLRARDLGISTADVNEALQSAFSGRRAGYFTMNGRQYEIIAQVDRFNRDDPKDLEKLSVRNSRGELVKLSSVINIHESSSPPQLYHYNRYKSATVQASLADGKTVAQGIQAMKDIAKRLLDDSYYTSLSGPSRDFEESSSNISFAFILALVLIFLVLAAQFESFVDPVTIMLTVPLALSGALISLWFFDMTLNIFSQIGMIMLIGLVTKNGILIIEFANQKEHKGENKMNATIDAAVQRLRPILMTSLATALGALPIALSLGAAATSRKPLGTVIVCGTLFALILTLFVIPAIHTYISSKKKAIIE